MQDSAISAFIWCNMPTFPAPLPLFQDYLRRGYYPFGRDEDFEMELMQVINQTI